MSTKKFIAFTGIILIIAFAMQNSNYVQLNFLIWSVKTNLTTIILSAFILVCLIGWLFKINNTKLKKSKTTYY